MTVVATSVDGIKVARSIKAMRRHLSTLLASTMVVAGTVSAGQESGALGSGLEAFRRGSYPAAAPFLNAHVFDTDSPDPFALLHG